MSNMTIGDNETTTVFDQAVLENVQQRITRVGVVYDWRDYNVGVNVTVMLKRTARVLMELIEGKGLSIPLTDSDIEAALLTIVELRCAQLNKTLPRGIFAADVPVPDFFRPFITQLGIFEDPMRGLCIHPVWVQRYESEVTDGKAEGDKQVTNQEYEHLMRVCRVLKASGMRITNGLPRMLVVDSDNVFRIQQTDKGELLVAGSDVSEVDILVRSMLRLQFLECVFGEARTRYVSVEDLRSAFDSIVTSAFLG